MFRYFFTYADGLPGNVGFRLFGPGHIAWLAAIACSTVFISLRYKGLSLARRRKLELSICWTIFALELLQYLYLIAKDALTPDLLPLHLCGMAVYISLLNALRPGKIKREILYSLCMPGAAMALIFPAWAAYPILNIVSLFCFLIHGLLVIYPIMLFAGGDLEPDYKNLPKCLLFLILIALPIYRFNKAFGTNFLFINYPSPGSPLVLFERWFGNPGYILGILILIFAVWAALYLPLVLMRRAEDKAELKPDDRSRQPAGLKNTR